MLLAVHFLIVLNNLQHFPLIHYLLLRPTLHVKIENITMHNVVRNHLS